MPRMCGTLGSSVLARKPKRSQRSIGKAGGFDGEAGVARRVAAAADRRPQSAVVGDLEDRAHRLAARDDVLIEAQVAARAQHATQLGECAGLVGDAAQHEAGDRRVHIAVGEWQGVGGAVAHGHGDGRAGRGVLGDGAQGRLGLDRDDLGDGGRVVREVQTVTCAHLQNAAGEIPQQSPAVLGGTAAVGARRGLHVHAREARAREVRAGGHAVPP